MYLDIIDEFLFSLDVNHDSLHRAVGQIAEMTGLEFELADDVAGREVTFTSGGTVPLREVLTGMLSTAGAKWFVAASPPRIVVTSL